MLETAKPSFPDLTNKDFKAVRSLRLDKDIRILLAEKGIILSYWMSLCTRNYTCYWNQVSLNHCLKTQQLQLGEECKNFFQNTKPFSPWVWNAVNRHIYLVCPRSINRTFLTNSSPCHALAGFLHKILSPLVGRTKSFVRELWAFRTVIEVSLQSSDTLVSFDVVRLFINVPVDEALQVIRTKLRLIELFRQQFTGNVWPAGSQVLSSL